MSGDKEIAIKSITSVQIKRAGTLTNGFIQIGFSGGKESKGELFDAAKDENTVMFNRQQEPAFLRAKALIDQYREQAHASLAPSPAPSSAADELAKLADLMERGYITKEEFEAKKKQILGL